MKVKSKKTIVISIVILLMISLSIFNYVSAHTHTYVKHSFAIKYDDTGADKHYKYEISDYRCECGASYSAITSSAYLAHTFTSYSYSGANYHSGTKHYFEYARSCIYCGHRDSYYNNVSCSGPPCTIPY